MATVSRITAGSHGKNKVSVLGPPRPCCLPQASAWALMSPLENKQTARENPLKVPQCPHTPFLQPKPIHWSYAPAAGDPREKSLTFFSLLLPSIKHPSTPSPTSGLPCPPFLFLLGEESKKEKITKHWLCAPGGVERAGARSVICKQKAAIVWDRYLRSRQGKEEGGLVSGLPNYSTHVHTIQTPAVLPPGNNMLFVHRGVSRIQGLRRGSQLTVLCCCVASMCWMRMGKCSTQSASDLTLLIRGRVSVLCGTPLLQYPLTEAPLFLWVSCAVSVKGGMMKPFRLWEIIETCTTNRHWYISLTRFKLVP